MVTFFSIGNPFLVRSSLSKIICIRISQVYRNLPHSKQIFLIGFIQKRKTVHISKFVHDCPRNNGCSTSDRTLSLILNDFFRFVKRLSRHHAKLYIASRTFPSDYHIDCFFPFVEEKFEAASCQTLYPLSD